MPEEQLRVPLFRPPLLSARRDPQSALGVTAFHKKEGSRSRPARPVEAATHLCCGQIPRPADAALAFRRVPGSKMAAERTFFL